MVVGLTVSKINSGQRSEVSRHSERDYYYYSLKLTAMTDKSGKPFLPLLSSIPIILVENNSIYMFISPLSLRLWRSEGGSLIICIGNTYLELWYLS